jgi:acetolactate synthase regulatory subunit
MTTMSAPTAPAPTGTTGRDRTLDVRLEGDDPNALLRVLGVLRRRGCLITHVDYRAADRHGPGWLTIGVEPPRGRGHSLEAWVGNLVDVAAVETL